MSGYLLDTIDKNLNIIPNPNLGQKVVYKYSGNEEGIESIKVCAKEAIVIKYHDGKLWMINFETKYEYRGRVVGGKEEFPLSGKSYATYDMRVTYENIFEAFTMIGLNPKIKSKKFDFNPQTGTFNKGELSIDPISPEK
jgi:hypothetical protein